MPPFGLLIVAQENLMRRVVFDHTFGTYIGAFPPDADSTWLDTRESNITFGYCRDKLKHRRDLFLGYSGTSAATAEKLRTFLEQDISATVLDCQTGLQTRQIHSRTDRGSARAMHDGIFLFTNDNLLERPPGAQAAPRDKVVFEAGYFATSKGKDRC